MRADATQPLTDTEREEHAMNVRGRLVFAFLLSIALTAATAQAATLFSPPLVRLGENLLDCYLLNVSDQVRGATIVVLNRQGDPVVDPATVTLQPWEERGATAEASLEPRYRMYVAESARSHYRASALVRKDGEGSVSALAAE
jgi:hypothetical protein